MAADTRQLRQLTVSIGVASARARVMARRAIQKVCQDTKADAKLLAPVDTGALKNSISYETHSDKTQVWGEVGPTVHYGEYVELGTSRMGPQPYMRPAFDRNVDGLEQALNQTGELP